MNRIGCIAVHYGKEYLQHAVAGLDGVIDEVHVFYAKEPSFGFTEGLACPDTEDELHAAAKLGCAGPLVWHRVSARNEQQHRQGMLAEADRRGATFVAIADADEIWDPHALDTALRAVEGANSAGRWLARFCHFWRSWDWTVVDGFRPVRIVDRRHPIETDAYLDDQMQPDPILHFGYAQSIATMKYKFSCHGHKAEFRPRWWEEKFLPWRPNAQTHDLHPCVNNLWPSAVPVDPAMRRDRLQFGHPYCALELIE